MQRRRATRRAWLGLAALLAASGCGMYGDLYLEEPELPARFIIPGQEEQLLVGLGALYWYGRPKPLKLALALAMVSVVIFPVLKQQDEILAIGYVLFRGALETVTYLASIIIWLMLLALSQQFVAAGAPDASLLGDADESRPVPSPPLPPGPGLHHPAQPRADGLQHTTPGRTDPACR